jgi:hypothetical protein
LIVIHAIAESEGASEEDDVRSHGNRRRGNPKSIGANRISHVINDRAAVFQLGLSCDALRGRHAEDVVRFDETR